MGLEYLPPLIDRPAGRLVLLVCAACLCLAACTALPQRSLPAPEVGSPGSPIQLEDCQLAAPSLPLRLGARCGKLAVYEDRAAGIGRQIELNIALIPAISRNPAGDPIFFIPGGPGEAATQSYPVLASAFERLNQKRAVILVDQRGTAGSNPLRCQAFDELEGAGEDSQALQKALADCLNALEADPALYTTAIAMDDLDQVRAALGFETINLYGASYGTRAALAYLRQYPNRVRTVILDGAAPPNWTLGPSTAADAQRALESIFERCAGDIACRAAFPNLAVEFQSLVEILEQPARVTVADPVSGEFSEFELTVEFLTSAIHALSYTPETVALLPLIIHTAANQQDYSLLAAQALAVFHNINESISSGMRLSVICAEDVPFYITQPAQPGYLGDSVVEGLREACKFWPHGTIPADFHTPVHSDVPVLILSGEADPVTPPANGELAAQTLPNSLHIITPGQGHINLFRGCIPDLATTFVETGSFQGLDTTCVEQIEPLPFFINFSGPIP